MPIPFYHPKPAAPGVFKDKPLPQNKANVLSRAVFQWIAPIMAAGYSRPLQPDDLWDLTEDLQSRTNADQLHDNFIKRLPPSLRPAYLQAKLSAPSVTSGISEQTQVGFDENRAQQEVATIEIIDDLAPIAAPGLSGDATNTMADGSIEMTVLKEDDSKKDLGPPGKPSPPEKEPKFIIEDGVKYDMSLVKAMYHTVAWRWWKAAILYGCGAALQITAPLITQKIISQMTIANEYDAAVRNGQSTAGLEQPRSVGYGIGLAVALFVMEMSSSLFTYQGQQRGAVMGFIMRASLVDLISRKSMRLSGKSRVEMTNGRLTTMVSADASFLDFAAPFTIEFFIQPIQIIVGIGLLIYVLGYSALVGLAVLVLATPMQGVMFIRMLTFRQAQMKVVDTRVRLLSEIINNIRAVKFYAYEVFFGERVSQLRRQELSKLRQNGFNRATMTATMSFIPILAAVLSFVTYGLSGHELNAATIFTALQYFNTLKQPITFLPLGFAAVTDAAVAIGRIGVMLRSEELKNDLVIDANAKSAIDVEGDFAFDSATPPDHTQGKRGGFGAKDWGGPKKAKKAAKEAKRAAKKGIPVKEEKKADAGVPFSLRDISLSVPRGSLVCVVGRVGTGKTALLSGMINEMKQTKGHVVFGGPVSYVPQRAWVQSGSIRDNITFSVDKELVDDERVNEVIEACALRTDIDMWPDGDMTKIGENGVTLSGGQRQRICLARAAYDTSSEIVLLDDPLSAVDAHVGHHILHNLILSGPLAHKTRLLVTHHLEVLPHADWVVVLDRVGADVGRIIQQGTYQDLRGESGVFRTLMDEFGAESESPIAPTAVAAAPEDTAKGPGGNLYMEEEREVGAVSWRVYGKYAKAMGSYTWVSLCFVFLCLTQASSVGNSLFLGFWSGSEISSFTQGDYMAVYAGLGAAVAIFTWLAAYVMILAGIRASFSLFNGAWTAVMRSPLSWHDRTPTGRIISRLSKDIEMLDDRLSQVWNQLLSNALSVVGTFALVVYSFPYLGLIFIPLGIFYYFAASYYRQTSREVKRIDSINRSYIYSSFGEQLTGLSVIRAFGRQSDFAKRLQDAVNKEGQAYIITITAQRWLGVRLDLLSYILVMLIAIFGAIFRDQVSPSKLGVVLSYSLSAASVFSQLVQLFAQVEQEMNNVERVQYYNDLPLEAAATLPSDPGPEWPSAGAVTFDQVTLRYRPELPLVLKGLTFDIKPGEKIGIVGRTGAGKSSISQALFRTVETEGTISIDGLDIRSVGLQTLRSRLAIIPQDPFLFGGTVRDNLDPTGSSTDAQLNDALHMIRALGAETLDQKFTLDAPVLNEGANYSAGERQLLSLIRALVRKSKIVLLDEATSSVDLQTDAVIQRIIQSELADVTILSVAHRIQTVAFFDRILVMDAGSVKEFDSPLALFDTAGSAFRALCDTKGLSRNDILKLQEDAAAAKKSN